MLLPLGLTEKNETAESMSWATCSAALLVMTTCGEDARDAGRQPARSPARVLDGAMPYLACRSRLFPVG